MFNFHRSKLFVFLIVLAFLSALVGCSPRAEKLSDAKAEKIVVTLDWTPNTNHTGLYVAKDLGFFELESLDVEIIQPAGGTAEHLVATENAHFGVSYQETVTFARAAELPVVSIAAIIQHNTSGFASLKEKGITRPRDFEGQRYGGWGSLQEEATIKALMAIDGGDYSKVDILNTGAVDFFVTSKKNADFSWIYFGWDGVMAEIKNVELNYIEVSQYDRALDYYTPVLITSESLIGHNPELVAKFLRATALGYQYTIEHPEEAANILLDNAPELDRELVLASQKWLKDKFQADAEIWGIQKKEIWGNYTKWLFDSKLLDEMIEIDKAFTNEFLPSLKD